MTNGHHLYVIAGPNGAGKTTFAKEFLPHFAKCSEFVNADLIAGGLSPFSAAGAAIEAGRIMLSRVSELAAQRRDFALETTLSGRGYLSLFRSMKRQGYRIHLAWTILDNSGEQPKLIAHEQSGRLQVFDSMLFLEIERRVERP